MSADVLRKAAALMRERAEAARDVTGASDWHPSIRGLTHAADYSVRSSGGTVAGDMAEEEAEHIASWHPAVALAVADWLDAEAHNAEAGIRGQGFFSVGGQSAALAVARLYLGSDA